jgi:hypothetical protein
MIFDVFLIKETAEELLALEKQHPQMVNRLRWLRTLKINPVIKPSELATQIGVPEYEMDRWAEFYQFGGIKLLLDPQTLLERVAANSLTFSEHAEFEMLNLFNNHPEQIGRRLWIDYLGCRAKKPSGTPCELFGDYNNFEKSFKNWRRTDCQTYIQDVIRYAYEKIGRRDLYDGLLKFYKTKNLTNGTVMAEYLVKNGWKTYLFMPDTENPRDGKPEHKKMYDLALRTKKWWNVPITDFIVNYNPTVTRDDGVRVLTPTKLDNDGKRKLDALGGVKFAVCVFTEAKHTGVFFRGKVLEVHWRSLSPHSPVGDEYETFRIQSLYEAKDLINFGWYEGIIVIPPDGKEIK